MSQKIQEALLKLDVSNDNHWTADGLPRLDTVKMLANDPGLTRESVTAAVPGFTRTNTKPVAPAPAPAPVAPSLTPPKAPDAAPAAPQMAQSDAQSEVKEGLNEAEFEPLSLEEELALAREELSDLAAAKAQIEAAYNAQIRKVDALIVAAEKTQVGDTNAKAIQAYLARQVEIGQERARRMEALKGVDLKSILPSKAPIDAAMNRRNSRGAQRPVRGG